MKKLYKRKDIEALYAKYGAPILLNKINELPRYRITVYSVSICAGTRVNSVELCASDIKSVLGLPIFEIVNSSGHMLLIVSDTIIKENSLLKIICAPAFQNTGMALPIAIGYTVLRQPIIADLAEMPHALYSGATNSGKSVGLISLVVCLTSLHSPNEVNLVIIDAGASSLDAFAELPHLSHPIVKDSESGYYTLERLVEYMENLNQYNVQERPDIVCIIDEFPALIDSAKDSNMAGKIENCVSKLLQRGRKAKIHIVLATQNPSTKRMKADIGNITTRMAFKCAKFQDSISAINCSGAEKLAGKGDMLFASGNSSEPLHLQGTYISEKELYQFLDYLKSLEYDTSNKFVIPTFNAAEEGACPTEEGTLIPEEVVELPEEDINDRMLAEIVLWALGQSTISANRLTSQFHIGDDKAASIASQLEGMGVVSELYSKQPRTVLPTCLEDLTPETMHLLVKHSYTNAEIAETIRNRQ